MQQLREQREREMQKGRGLELWAALPLLGPLRLSIEAEAEAEAALEVIARKRLFGCWCKVAVRLSM